MAEYRIGVLPTGIYVGKVSKDKTMWLEKTEVTDEATNAVAIYMAKTLLDEKKISSGYVWTLDDDMTLELRVSLLEQGETLKVTKLGKSISEQHFSDEFICSECGFCGREISNYDAEDDVYKEFRVKYCPNCGAYIEWE